MNIISLSPATSSLILEPTEDTLYLLTSGSFDINLTLKKPAVRAYILGLFFTEQNVTLTINQHHLAPATESHVLLKSLVAPSGNFFYQGNLLIEKSATGSNASQEARGLLLGSGARFKAIPALEIKPENVTCKHKASSTPINQESLYTLQTKGFSDADAQTLLQRAFLNGAKDTLLEWNFDTENTPALAAYFEKIAL